VCTKLSKMTHIATHSPMNKCTKKYIMKFKKTILGELSPTGLSASSASDFPAFFCSALASPVLAPNGIGLRPLLEVSFDSAVEEFAKGSVLISLLTTSTIKTGSH